MVIIMKNIFSLKIFKFFTLLTSISFYLYAYPSQAQSYDMEKSSAYLKSACYKRFAAKDYTNSLNCTEDFAKRDDIVAEYYLGLMYYKGKGVKTDFKRAYKSFLRAADKGYAPAQNSLGVMFDNGKGVIQNFRTAFSWYLKAASRAHVVAQYNIGNMFYKGRGVLHDYKQAYIWFLIAASNGHREAIQLRDSLAVTLLPKQLEAAQDEAKLIADAIDDGSILSKESLAKEPESLDPKAKQTTAKAPLEQSSKTPVPAKPPEQAANKAIAPAKPSEQSVNKVAVPSKAPAQSTKTSSPVKTEQKPSAAVKKPSSEPTAKPKS